MEVDLGTVLTELQRVAEKVYDYLQKPVFVAVYLQV
jgi:hypothetical protein